ncbi:serine/threonine-protein kinase [Streptosporangium sp. NBC_01469]|uniref:serine/threonine-protein kinase n=1 Tax=Streptosporangium sp. NBC_01469 TaxID=2903898 RepID=UPI002E2BDFE1|nr:serine/threonine protein kinase [Streptosporangium sp. NBC_01469]
MVAQGTTLAGRYRLSTRIGAGGMGEVWKGEDIVLARTVAVKVLLPGRTDDPGFLVRFQGEARAMATINHPGVVDVYDYGVHEVPGAGATAYLVMKFVDGEPLDRLLGRLRRIAPRAAMDLIAQAASALQAVHDQGIVHRDIKPGNLMVRSDGTLVLTDFGIARSDTASRLTDAGMVLGTAAYCAPEQAEGAPVTPAVDIYALGVVAYECLAGQRPFDGDTPVTIALKHIREAPPPLPPDVPPAARALVERSLAKDPARRFPSATAMSAAARQAALGAEGGDTLSASAQQAEPPETGWQAQAPQGGPQGQTGRHGQGSATPQTGWQGAQAPTGSWQDAQAPTGNWQGSQAPTSGWQGGSPHSTAPAAGAGAVAEAGAQGRGRRAAQKPRRKSGLVAVSAVAAVMCAGLVAVAINGMADSRDASNTDPMKPAPSTAVSETKKGPTRKPPTRKPSLSPSPTVTRQPQNSRPTPDATEEKSPSPTPTVTKTPKPTPTPTPTPTPKPKRSVPGTVGMKPGAAEARLKQEGFKVTLSYSADVDHTQCVEVVESRPSAGTLWDPSKPVEIIAVNVDCPPTPTPTPTATGKP